MLVTYPALFYFDDTDGANAPFFVAFPDFEHSATQGADIADAMAMASDWLGMNLADYIENGRDIPTPSSINTFYLSTKYTKTPKVYVNFGGFVLFSYSTVTIALIVFRLAMSL